MDRSSGTHRPSLRVRVAFGLRKEPDYLAMSDADLVAFRDAANRQAASPLFRLITGFPDRAATIEWQQVRLPDRALAVRVYRPRRGRPPGGGWPLVLHVHGGGFMGTAVACDWVNSYLAAQLPAVVVSVEHRLVGPGTALSAAVDDGWDVLSHVLRYAARWEIDPDRVAVFGESAGATIAGVTAIKARQSGLALQGQVLVNPCLDLTATAFDYDSMTEHANTPTLDLAQLELFGRLAVPSGTDPSAVSPLYADDLSGLPPALIVVPTLDPLADHGRTYAERLRDAETPARVAEHARAGHAFLSMPGLVPAARRARRDIRTFLHGSLHRRR